MVRPHRFLTRGHNLYGVLHLHPLPAHVAGVQNGGSLTLRLSTCPRMLTQGATEPLSDPGVGELEGTHCGGWGGVTGLGENRPTEV